MRIGIKIMALGLVVGALVACDNEIKFSRVDPEPGASSEVQYLVSEIDAMLVVSQDAYPDGAAFSAAFQELRREVMQQQQTLRTARVAKRVGTLAAMGEGVAWDPQTPDIERLAGEWRGVRPDVLAGP